MGYYRVNITDGVIIPTTNFQSSMGCKSMIERGNKEVEMLERHLDILLGVIENEPIGIVRLSDECGYEQYNVRYSLRVLEEQGLVEPSQ
jgi:predicted transcriptional regulator